MPPPSVLEYARHYGLTLDHRSAFDKESIAIIGRLSEEARGAIDGSSLYTNLENLLPTLPSSGIAEDKFQLTNEQVSQLQHIISPPALNLHFDSQIWDDVLPKPNPFKNMYLDKPLLHIGDGDMEKDVERIREGVKIDDVLQDIQEDHEIGNTNGTVMDIGDIDTERRILSQACTKIEAELGEQKLETSQKAFIAIKDAAGVITKDELTWQLVRDELFPNNKSGSRSPLPVLAIDDYIDCEEPQYTFGEHAPPHMTQASTRSRGIPNVDNIPRSTDNAKDCQNPPIHIGRDAMMEKACQTCVTETEGVLETKRSLSGTGSPSRNGNVPKRRKTSLVHLTSQSSSSADSQIQAPSTKGHTVLEPAADPISCVSQDLTKEMYYELTSERLFGPGNDRTTNPGRSLTESVKVWFGASDGNSNQKAKLSKLVPNVLPKVDIRMPPNGPTKPLSTIPDGKKVELNFDTNLEQIPTLAFFSAKPVEGTTIGIIENENELPERVMARNEQPFSSGRSLCERHEIRLIDRPGVIDEEHVDRSSNSTMTQVDRVCSTESARTGSPVSLLPTPELKARCLDTGQTADSSSLPAHSLDEFRKKVHEKDALRGGGLFSTSASLSSLLDLRGKSLNKPKYSSHYCRSELGDDPSESIQQSITSASLKSHSKPTSDTLLRAVEATGLSIPKLSLTQPQCGRLKHHRTVVVNSALMQSRPALVAYCERRGDGYLKIVYRDFRDFDGEAPDITLDAKSCLVITNIQLFEQQSLPGQQRRRVPSNGHVRLMNLCERYERVIVIISRPAVRIPTDSAVMAGVAAFCSSVRDLTSSIINAVYVTYQSPQQLTTGINVWVWASIHKLAYLTSRTADTISHDRVNVLIEDETVWELFLRKAGLNVIAAQIVIGTLRDTKRRQNCSQKSSIQVSERVSGLGQFICMTTEERRDTFGVMIGNRAVEKTSSMIDRPEDDRETQ